MISNLVKYPMKSHCLKAKRKMFKVGFDNEAYLKTQSEKIAERIAKFGGKLYLEFGGKLFDDHHASRVLPGFAPDSKIRMLEKIKDKAEVIIAINAGDIEKNKVRGDLGITYDQDVLRLIDAFRGYGLYVSSVVLTRWQEQPSAIAYQKKLEGLDVCRVSGNCTINEFVETTRELVVVTAPGPGSGKMAVCLSQIYHENKRGVKAGYAKFETFPIWNIPLKHPVNLAYEAATADLNDVNMIDPFHLEAYGQTTINYNRDVEIFPVLNALFTRILGESPYKSPTDMGVNMAGNCIIDDDAVCEAAKQEIIRRYYNTLCDVRKGNAEKDQIYKQELIMEQAQISTADRPVIAAAVEKAEQTGGPAVAIQLNDGAIISAKTSSLLGASSAMLLDALKHLAKIPDEVRLLSPMVIEPIQNLKTKQLGHKNPRLHMDEALVALSVCALTDYNAKIALEKLPELRHCEVHSSVILSQVDVGVFRRLGVNLTTEPNYQSGNLYHG